VVAAGAALSFPEVSVSTGAGWSGSGPFGVATSTQFTAHNHVQFRSSGARPLTEFRRHVAALQS
jgi:hypothetical protein